jgi:hypothetical protein
LNSVEIRLSEEVAVAHLRVATPNLDIYKAVSSIFDTNLLVHSFYRRTYLIALKAVEMQQPSNIQRNDIHDAIAKVFVRRRIVFVHQYGTDRFWRDSRTERPPVRYLDYKTLVQSLENDVPRRRRIQSVLVDGEGNNTLDISSPTHEYLRHARRRK